MSIFQRYQPYMFLRRFRGFSSQMEKGARLGFIGLGSMGRHMAGHFVKGGFNPLVYDRDESAMVQFKERWQKETELTFRTADSVQQIANLSNIIFTMLPTGKDVGDTYFGPKGKTESLEGIFPNEFSKPITSFNKLTLVDCSTIGPQVAQELSKRVMRLGHHHVDAPVTGGVHGAEKAALTFICGGKIRDVDNLKPFFDVMGRHVFYCGPSGSGQLVKLCNNAILAVTMIAVSDSLRLAKAANVDVKFVNEIYNTGSAKSWVTEVYNPVPGVIPTSPASNNYMPGFKTELLEKDLNLILDAAHVFSVDMPSVRLAQSLYHKVIQLGGAAEDFSVVYKYGASLDIPNPCNDHQNDSTIRSI